MQSQTRSTVLSNLGVSGLDLRAGKNVPIWRRQLGYVNFETKNIIYLNSF